MNKSPFSSNIAANDRFWLSAIQLNVGTSAQDYSPKTTTEELLQVRRLISKYSAETNYTYYVTGQAAGTKSAQGMFFKHTPPMRIPPSMTTQTAGSFGLTVLLEQF